MPSIFESCKDCKKQFEFNEAEQMFYKARGLLFPKRCKECRAARKKNNAPGPVAEPLSPDYTKVWE